MFVQVAAMVQSRQQPVDSFRELRDRDSWPQLTAADREYLLVQRRGRLADIVIKHCSSVIKLTKEHHVSDVGSG